MKRIKYILLATLILFLTSLACNALLPQTEPTSAPTSIETQILVPTPTTEPVATQPEANLPQTDAEVPRVPVDQAKLPLIAATQSSWMCAERKPTPEVM